MLFRERHPPATTIMHLGLLFRRQDICNRLGYLIFVEEFAQFQSQRLRLLYASCLFHTFLRQ